MHDLLLYDFNLCYNLMKKPLFELAMAYKKFVCQTVSDIKTFERPKNIKELDDSLLRNYWNKTKYVWLNNGEI